MNKRKLIRDQLDRKMAGFIGLKDVIMPPNGWIYSIRQGIHMSLRQLGQRLDIAPQSVKEIETREKKGTISINVLKQVATALDMDFVYGFIPREGTLDQKVDKRAERLAKQIVERTSVQMGLEDQKTSEERIRKAIDEKARELADKMPSMLWD